MTASDATPWWPVLTVHVVAGFEVSTGVFSQGELVQIAANPIAKQIMIDVTGAMYPIGSAARNRAC